jgi:formate dehydrogenase alpha subunit
MDLIITLTIDNRSVKVPNGSTILEAASAAGIDIPHLCKDDRLTPTGSCRLCLVEVEGQAKLQASCATPALEGMVVRTETPELRSLRRTVLELLIAEHRLSCTTCERDGSCLLQDYCYRYGINEHHFTPLEHHVRTQNYTLKEKAFVYDPSKCIRCGRCVKICAEVQGVHAITFAHRSQQTVVTTGFNEPLKYTVCETCGQCVGTCPTGALYPKAAKRKGQTKDLIKTRTTCVYCGVGCQIDLNVNRRTGELVMVSTETGSVPNDGNTCVKGRFGLDFIQSPKRLKKPLIREHGTFREASWDEALDLVARRFTELKQTYGPDSLAGFTSARATNEENYLVQKFVRTAFGTNNIDHCARLCHASTVTGLAKAFGSGAMTNSINDIRGSGAIFVIGSNTTECHPVIGITVRQAADRNEAVLIVADPRSIPLTRHAHLHLKHRPGTDTALLNAIMQVIIEEGLEDRSFIEKRTEGYGQLCEAVAPYTPEFAEKICGVPAEQIRKAARMIAQAPTASILYSMGITQHTTGTDNVLSVANLAMLTGNVGKPFAGVDPLRGQNNVQGACDMGGLPDVYSGYQKVADEAAREKFSRAWGAELPSRPGLTVVEIMHGAAEGTVKGLFIVGENPMLSDPDITHVKEALEQLDFLVVQDIFLTETAELADVVLPAASFAEKEGTFTNTERRVQMVRKALPPPGEARTDWEIICSLSQRMGYPMEYRSAEQIMEEIAALTPIYGGITHKRLQGIGLQWPCPDEHHPGTPYLYPEQFNRPGGRGKFHPVTFIPPQELPDEQYPLILTTGRMLQHWHTGTMTRKSSVLHDLVPHGALEIHPDDAAAAGLSAGETALVESRRGAISVPVAVTEKVRRGTVFMAFHFHEHPANALTIAALDPLAKIPEFKACAVQVRKPPVMETSRA